MNKTNLLFLGILGLLIGIFSACNNAKTAQEYQQEERKAIERFISRENIKVLKSFPEDSVFQANEFFRTSDGLYMRIVEPGTGDRFKVYDEILVRFDYYRDVKEYIKGDTIKRTIRYDLFPVSFIYGIPGSYDLDMACQGWTIPLQLQYLRENAVVDLLIPSSLGSAVNSQDYRAMYFSRLRYGKRPQ
jgi:hypothetical protein